MNANMPRAYWPTRPVGGLHSHAEHGNEAADGILALISYNSCYFNDLPRSERHKSRRVKVSTRRVQNWTRRNKKRSRRVLFDPKRGLFEPGHGPFSPRRMGSKSQRALFGS